MAANQAPDEAMKSTIFFAVTAAAVAALALIWFDETLELLVWEFLLLGILFVLFRNFPKRDREPGPRLFGWQKGDPPRPPRSVSTFELAAVHAYSESPGADQRLKAMMRRIANHRLAKRGIGPGSIRASELVDESLFDDTPHHPLTAHDLERIVQQLESL